MRRSWAESSAPPRALRFQVNWTRKLNWTRLPRIFNARSPLRCSHHGQETGLLRWIVAEHASVAAGEGRRAVLGDAPHRHAGMLGLDQDGNAARFEDLVDRSR